MQRTGGQLLAGALSALLLSGCMGSASPPSVKGKTAAAGTRHTSVDLTAGASRHCAAEQLTLRHATRVAAGQASRVAAGHLPGRLPRGFALQEVDRVEPGHLGYVAWTDSACRRIAVVYAPGVTSISGSATHAFGPWMKLQGCGAPRPCVVYQGGVSGGLVTFSTQGIDPQVTAELLHTVSTGDA